VIVRDDTRDDCIARALRVLQELEVSGVPTTREVALEILDSEEFRSGDYSTSFLDEVQLAALA
jgi:acetyl-CoA carboxylase, biotin carboxylase subunit